MSFEGRFLGVFCSDPAMRNSFLGSVAKKSEAEGTIVYHRIEGGTPFTFLADDQFPERVQGYSRVASISDYAYYLLPKYGKLTPPDGELALLLDSFNMEGKIEAIDEPSPPNVTSSFRGTCLERYAIETRDSRSSMLNVAAIERGANSPPSGTLVYVDQAFNVKGVGVVVLGFVLAGSISLHDKLRLIPSLDGRKAEVRGIQVSDVDQERVGRGIRVGLSLKGVELKDLSKVAWLDDASFQLDDNLTFDFSPNRFYKQSVAGRELHIQLPGELLLCNIKQDDSKVEASLPNEVPVWEGMKVSLIDLNGGNLRVAGGGKYTV